MESAPLVAEAAQAVVTEQVAALPTAAEPVASAESKPRRGGRRPRKASEAVGVPPPVAETPRSESAAADEKPAKPKRPARTPRARKPKPGETAES